MYHYYKKKPVDFSIFTTELPRISSDLILNEIDTIFQYSILLDLYYDLFFGQLKV